MSYVPHNMRASRSAGKSHYYVNPRTIDIYPSGQQRVRLTLKQLQQAVAMMEDYAKNRSAKQ